MPLPAIPIDDFFPVIRQTILDTYKVDSFLMRAPYTEFERLDMGLRKMVWGTYSTTSPIFTLPDDPNASPYQIIVLESVLGFYNIVIELTDDAEPDSIAFMPFRLEPISVAAMGRIMKENGIPTHYTSSLYQIYSAMPVLSLNDFVTTLQHLFTAFIPAFSSSHVEYVNYRTEVHEVTASEDRIDKFFADFIVNCNLRVKECMNAITSGNQAAATAKLKSLLDFTAAVSSPNIAKLKEELLCLNVHISAHMYETSVHPYYTFRQMQAFQNKIEDTNSYQELQHLPFDMVRKYSLLAKNYSYEKYSYLVRNVINYIDQHLAGDLSLSLLAKEFEKNASYLSNEFKKEVGDTLTNYIVKQRIQTALRYFNTTGMSVSDVAVAVGFSDFGYFSKQFKKHVGISPSNYKKMLSK